jgi:penicillin-binding protein
MSSNNKNNSSGFDSINQEQLKKFGRTFSYYFDIFYRVMKGLVGIVVILLVVIAALAGGATIGYFASLVDDTPIPTQAEMSAQVNDYNQKSTLYYADNSRISDLRADLIRTPVSLDHISPLIINAVIATEDENFRIHNGIVPKAIIRAGVQELSNAPTVSGGSTLTQQLIKQQILSAEVTHSRKAVEILYAMHMENHFSKEEILEAYMNVSPFGRNNLGQNIAGIEEAAQGIFGIASSEVNLPQAAFLAGLPQSPISYSPYTQTGHVKEDLEAGLYRQQEVLYSMFREGYIEEEDYQAALDYDVTADFLRQEDEEDSDPSRSYVYDLVEREARTLLMESMYQEDGITTEQIQNNSELYTQYEEEADAQLRNGGYDIYSTIDPVIHNAVEQRVGEIQGSFGNSQTVTFNPEDGESYTIEYPVQVGGTMIENETGRVLSFIGGRDYDVSEYNIAFDSQRGTGSAIKPLIVYGPALAQNYITPATIVPDTELIVDDGINEPHNVSNVGRTTNDWGDARRWLAISQNIPTTRIYLGMLENGMNPESYIRNMGIGPDSISENDFYLPSSALGGFANGPTITEVAGAYGAIGNQGVFNEPYVIERIVNANGDVIYQHEQDPVRVWPESANYLLYDILRDVTTSAGTAQSIPGQLNFNVDLASKTGTTNETRDVWYAGVTPNLSFTTWMGYDNQNLSLEWVNGVSPAQRNLSNWANIMNAVHSVKPEVLGLGETVQQPADVTSDTVLAATGMKAGTVNLPNGNSVQISGETKNELFRSDNIPGTTTYDFAIGASSSALQNFWNDYINTSEPADSDNTNDSNDSNNSSDSDNDENENNSDSSEEENADAANDEENSADENNNENEDESPPEDSPPEEPETEENEENNNDE